MHFSLFFTLHNLRMQQNWSL